MVKFSYRVTMVDGSTIYGNWLRGHVNKSWFFCRDGLGVLIEKPDMFDVSITKGDNVLKLSLPSRKSVYAAVTYSPYLIDHNYYQFIIDNYGSIENYLENYCCTFEYAREKQNERKKRRKGV